MSFFRFRLRHAMMLMAITAIGALWYVRVQENKRPTCEFCLVKHDARGVRCCESCNDRLKLYVPNPGYPPVLIEELGLLSDHNVYLHQSGFRYLRLRRYGFDMRRWDGNKPAIDLLAKLGERLRVWPDARHYRFALSGVPNSLQPRLRTAGWEIIPPPDSPVSE